MALSETHLVVGSGTAEVWIFKKDGSGNYPTTATAIIPAVNAGSAVYNALALSETHLVVGASWYNNNFAGTNKVYIFKKDGSGDYPTTVTATISGRGDVLQFGANLALSETHLVVGACGWWSCAVKKVWIFKKDGSGNYPATVPASATAIIDGYTAHAGFGWSLALSETHLAVGSGSKSGAGDLKVWIFKKNGSGDYPTTATTTITSTETHFGYALALSSTHLVVGAYGAKKAFIFKKDGSGDYPTTATASLTGFTGEVDFGFSVALSETHLVIGAPGSKKAAIFKKDGSGDYPTTATVRPVWSVPDGAAFGAPVVVSSNQCVIGAYRYYSPNQGAKRAWIFKAAAA